jgi:hypothetical protein
MCLSSIIELVIIGVLVALLLARKDSQPIVPTHKPDTGIPPGIAVSPEELEALMQKDRDERIRQ